MPEFQTPPQKDTFPFEQWFGLPVVGLDRNQPLRRYFSRTGHSLPVRHLDPGVVYHWPGRRVVRRSSVESWIETCRDLFPGHGIRDFWETVWNVAVCAWDYMDRCDKEPWRKPNPGFPFMNPSFWRGARRFRLLFVDSKSFVAQFPVKDSSAFLDWIETIVRFQYGAGLESIPFGMVALALNAPSESYLLEVDSTDGPWTQEGNGYQGAWRIPFEVGRNWTSQDCPVHQVFLDPPLPGLLAQTIVLSLRSQSKGYLFLRTQPANAVLPGDWISSLEQALNQCIGPGCGSLNHSGLQRVPACPLVVGLPVESRWPWLGCARSLLQWGRKEETG